MKENKPTKCGVAKDVVHFPQRRRGVAEDNYRGAGNSVERTQKLLYKNASRAAWKPRVPHYIDNRIT
jgi:hypothetical protein